MIPRTRNIPREEYGEKQMYSIGITLNLISWFIFMLTDSPVLSGIPQVLPSLISSV
jgi:hypothetical protein